jgi:hypothetical protein
MQLSWLLDKEGGSAHYETIIYTVVQEENVKYNTKVKAHSERFEKK